VRQAGPRFALRSGAHEKMTAPPENHESSSMDAEHINQIGTTLADLAGRTADLRRYL
jgi:hypothetical protein